MYRADLFAGRNGGVSPELSSDRIHRIVESQIEVLQIGVYHWAELVEEADDGCLSGIVDSNQRRELVIEFNMGAATPDSAPVSNCHRLHSDHRVNLEDAGVTMG
jgi:hypothetical protein